MIKVRLIKRATDDGLVEVNDDVPLGKEYLADWDTRKMETGYNIPYGQFWKRELVWIDNTWFPTELLEVI